MIFFPIDPSVSRIPPIAIPPMKSSIVAVSAKLAPFLGAAGVMASMVQIVDDTKPLLSVALPVIITIFVALVGVVYHDMNRRQNENAKENERLSDAIVQLRKDIEKKDEANRRERELLAMEIRKDSTLNFKELNERLSEIKAAVLGIGPTGEGGLLSEVRRVREDSHKMDNQLSVLERRLYVVEKAS